MNEPDLRDALRRLELPDEPAAAERTWRVLAAAYAGKRPAAPVRRPLRRLVPAIAVAALGLALALTPAGADVRRWIGDRVARETRSGLSDLPAAGRLLAASRAGGAWVVDQDGALRRLGGYSAVDWSPHGLFAAAARGRRLWAVEPDGTVRWSVIGRGRVSDPAWAPGKGYRVAYRSAGELRVVGGNGTADALVASRTPAVTPAWRPGEAWVLTFAARSGLVTLDVDSRRRLWSAPLPETPIALEWTAAGDRLVVLLRRELRVYGPNGGIQVARELPGAGVGDSLAVDPAGRTIALTSHADGAGRVLSVPVRAGSGQARTLFEGGGHFSGLAFSPDGRWLLAAWHATDQWVFLRVGGRRRVLTFSRMSEGLSPDGAGRTGFPAPAGWCCPEDG